MVSNRRIYFRTICFLIALGYTIYQFIVTDYSNFGIQFRYLTIWGLTTAFIAFAILTRQTYLGQPENNFGLISATAVLNAMVLFLYWKLYFTDPKLVNGSGEIIWFQEYYLHLVGPLLIMFDALFINRAFHQIKRGLSITIAICVLYILWSELLTGPLNDTPVGTHTSGLPYPFLNNMSPSDRGSFYITTLGTAVFFYCVGWVINWSMTHIRTISTRFS